MAENTESANSVEQLEQRRSDITQKMRDADAFLAGLEAQRKAALVRALHGLHSKDEQVLATMAVDSEFKARRFVIVRDKRAAEVELIGIKRQLRHLRQQAQNDELHDRRDIVDVLFSIEELLGRLVDRVGA